MIDVKLPPPFMPESKVLADGEFTVCVELMNYLFSLIEQYYDCAGNDVEMVIVHPNVFISIKDFPKGEFKHSDSFSEIPDNINPHWVGKMWTADVYSTTDCPLNHVYLVGRNESSANRHPRAKDGCLLSDGTMFHNNSGIYGVVHESRAFLRSNLDMIGKKANTEESGIGVSYRYGTQNNK